VIRKPGCQTAAWRLEPFTCADECLRDPDLYDEFGIDFSATDKEIKQVFRKLSLKYHPDKTRNDKVLTARFNQIRAAYDILGSVEKRSVYDLLGYAKTQEMEKLEKSSEMKGFLNVNLEILYNGGTMTTTVNRKLICPKCRESASNRCKRCRVKCANEVEYVNVRMGPMMMKQQQSVASKEKCRMEEGPLNVEIERGSKPGDILVFKGKGEQVPQRIPGDVKLELRLQENQQFQLQGNHLHLGVSISLKEALVGFTKRFTQLDGREIVIRTNNITKPGAVIQVAGEGMPHRGDATQFGDLYVQFSFLMPKDSELTGSTREWLSANFPE